ncbi:hypothetical protein FIV00_26235 [Labrenzia sp. THAF82]|nr:hypothetical protein FIV00_26235 [Labrenzia sp. THAF82]
MTMHAEALSYCAMPVCGGLKGRVIGRIIERVSVVAIMFGQQQAASHCGQSSKVDEIDMDFCFLTCR